MASPAHKKISPPLPLPPNMKAAIRIAKQYSEKRISPEAMHNEAMVLRRQAAFRLVAGEEEDSVRWRLAATESAGQWHRAYLLDLAATLNETDFGRTLLPKAGPETLLSYSREFRVAAGHLSAHLSEKWDHIIIDNISEGCRMNAKADICVMRARELMDSQ